MVEESACLGLEILGNCSYDPSNPERIYFSIGELIGVIALLMAFLQLSKPIIKFRIRVGCVSEKIIYGLFFVAIIFVLLSAILPFIPGTAVPLLGYPVFWEVSAGFFFVFGSTILIRGITKKSVFSKRNAYNYLNGCTSIIAKGNEEDLRELADEISKSIEPIVKQCKKYDRDKATEAEVRGRPYEVEEATQIALRILDLWSDPTFCKNIICRSPGTAIEVFKQIINYKLYSGGGSTLTQELLNQAFSNQDSILMRESQYSGLGFFNLFTKTVFDNRELVESNHRPLQAWKDYREEQIKPWQAEKYCSCLHIAIRAYFKAKDYQNSAAMYGGIDKLAGFALSQTASIQHLSEAELYQSANLKVLSTIQQGFEEIIDIIEKHQDNIPVYELNESNYNKWKDTSIYGILANGIYCYFERLAVTFHDRALRHDGIGIWIKVFGVKGTELSKTQIEIGKRLLIHLNKKIDENLDAEQRWYPAITRLIISFNGIYESDDETDQRIEAKFHRDFIRRLKTKYPKLVKRDPKFAVDMLPENVVYDKDKNELHETGLRNRVTVLKLEDII